MSTQRPRRHSVEVYWRRRLTVLASAFLVAWLCTQVFAGAGADEPDPAPEAKPAKPAKPAEPPETAETAALNGAIDVSLAKAEVACDPGKLQVTPSVPKDQFTDEEVDIALMVRTSQKSACTMKANESDLLVVISAGDTAVWDSSVCRKPFFDETATVTPGWTTVVDAAWSGRGSGQACSKDEAFAAAGSYTVKMATIGGEPTEATFSLINEPEPEDEPDEDAEPAEAEDEQTEPDEDEQEEPAEDEN